MLAASGSGLVACGGDSDWKRAVDRFNGGPASTSLREAVEKGGGVSFCRLTEQAGNTGNLLLTVVLKSDGWLQATIHPERTVRFEDVTTGKSFTGLFGAQAEKEFRTSGTACKVSPADATISLD